MKSSRGSKIAKFRTGIIGLVIRVRIVIESCLMATIGRFFNFGVFSTDSRRELEFEISLSETGWLVRHGVQTEACDPSGPESLYKEIDGHKIHLSDTARKALSELHEKQKTYTDRALQQRIQAIGLMLSVVERAV